MAYPAIEEFALASLGYLWLYKLADMQEGINATRISTYNIPNVRNVGAIAFSMSFDFDFMGVFVYRYFSILIYIFYIKFFN